MINEILDFFKTVFSGSGFFSLGCNVWNSLIAYAFDMLQTSPQSLADGELWDEGYRIFLALQILGATQAALFLDAAGTEEWTLEDLRTLAAQSDIDSMKVLQRKIEQLHKASQKKNNK